MIATLLAALLLAVAPARAGRVETAAHAGVANVPAFSAPLAAPPAAPLIDPLASASAVPTAPPIVAAPAAVLAPAADPAGLPPAPFALTPPALGPPSLPAASSEGKSAAAPASQSRIRKFLSRIVEPFGKKPADEAAPADEAERLDREFSRTDFWAAVAPAARSEIEGLRARKLTKDQTREYVRRETRAAIERIQSARGTENIAFHYNLHGGNRESYVGAGIRASRGNVALRHTTNADANDKVYFFQTAAHDPYDALDASKAEQLFFPSRMGTTLSVFALDAPEIKSALADGRIDHVTKISMDFHKGMSGVPYSAFLAPPLRVFTDTAEKIGLKKLSRDEETLATARYLEAALTSGARFVPR